MLEGAQEILMKSLLICADELYKKINKRQNLGCACVCARAQEKKSAGIAEIKIQIAAPQWFG